MKLLKNLSFHSRRSNGFIRCASLLVTAFCWQLALRVQAQWTTQTIVLQPGWNAVYLEVQPEPRDCDTLFADLPVESVWGWNRRFTTVQFIQDSNNLLPGQPDWLTYFPLAAGNRSLNSLFALHGDRCYLIKSTAAQPVTWTLQGKPVPPVRDWLQGSFNLVGFPVDPAAPPSFRNFFAPSPAHAGQPVYRLQPSGAWLPVTNTTTAKLRSGEAFWAFASQASSYAGPLGVTLEQARQIDYGRTLGETFVTLKNSSTVNRTVLLTPVSSLQPTEGVFPAVAGDVPLSYWRINLAQKIYGWFPVQPQAPITLNPGQELKVRVSVSRTDFTPYVVPPGFSDSQYQSVLVISDQAGSRISIPVTARPANVPAPSVVARSQDSRQANVTSATSPDPHAGLWVGSAVINAVSQAAGSSDPTLPRPTGSQANLRLILHVNNAGQVRLLQQVMLMWTNGTLDSFGNVLQLGQQVLITDDSLVGQYTGAALRDGRAVARRISTVAFSNRTPIPLNGPFGDLQNSLTGTLITDYDDPLNPFKHRYHPDHDNLDEEHKVILPEGVESFTIQRAIQLRFTADDPEGRARANFGDNELGGTYTETITGVHKVPIVIQGFFKLNRVSLIPFLNKEG